MSDQIELENWMSTLPRALSTIPLIYLSIPGSHNSFSYSITQRSDVSPDSPLIVQNLAKWFKPIVSRIVFNWSLGQDQDVVKQLQCGIRYFDIRLVLQRSAICVAHGLFGGQIVTFLQCINEFLNSHQQEVVILDFQHFYQFNLQDHEEVLSLIHSIFGNKICLRQNSIKNITLDGMWRTKNQVVVIYRTSIIASPMVWPSHAWITPWPNKLNVDELLQYLDNGLKNRQEDVGLVTQGILTPNVRYVCLHMCGSLKRLALQNNRKLTSWLESKTNGSCGVNVVICDFVESHHFCKKVVQLNYKNCKSDRGDTQSHLSAAKSNKS